MFNPVAKHSHKTNKCIAFRSKKQYSRKNKHKEYIMTDINIVLSHFNLQWQDHLHTVYNNKQNAFIVYLFDQWNLGMISLNEFRQLILLDMENV